MVTINDVFETLKKLGITDGDVILIHSSLKSFGRVDGGADAVIDGAIRAVGKGGTVVVPTLLTRSFKVAYEIWDKDVCPSEVGLISETLRLRKGAFRSDQATHSVAAVGDKAEYLTSTHSTSKARIFPYGDYAFSHGSPWQKMYDLNAKIVMMGAPYNTITFRHFVEAVYCERLIDNIQDEQKRERIKARLVSYDRIFEYNQIVATAGNQPITTDMVRFQFGTKESQELDATITQTAYCGESLFTVFSVKDYVDGMLKDIEVQPEKYYSKRVLDFIKEITA